MSRPVPFQFQTLACETLVANGPAVPGIPRSSGVFRIFDVLDKLILLEKTHNLAHRIRSFYGFDSEIQESRALDLREITARVEFCRTDTPMETLYLLYLERRRWFPSTYRTMRTLPRYHLLKINRRQRFPRLYAARQIKEGVAYFGPFVRRSELDRLKAVLERTFRIRPCEYNIRGDDPYPDCLYFQMRTCSRPCNGDIGRSAYLADIEDALLFVEGREKDITDRTRAEIERLSDETHFEEAARLGKHLARIERARRDHRDTYHDIWKLDLVVVLEAGSARRKKIALVTGGRIVAFEEHGIDHIEETLAVLIRAQRSSPAARHAPEHHYDEFCLVTQFLIKPVAGVRFFPLRAPETTAAEVARHCAEEIETKRKRAKDRGKPKIEVRDKKS